MARTQRATGPSWRQTDVLRLYYDLYQQGINSKESYERIAKCFGTAVGTVKKQIHEGYQHLGIHSRQEISLALSGGVKWAFQEDKREPFRVGECVWYDDGPKVIVGPRVERNVIGFELVESDSKGNVCKNARRVFVTEHWRIYGLPF